MRVTNKSLYLYLVGLTALIGGFAQNMYTPILPQAQQELHTSSFLINLSVTIYTVSMAAMQLVFGPVVDRRGRKSVLVAGLALFALATFGCAYSPSIVYLLAFRILQGIGAATIPVVAAAVIGDLFEGQALIRGMGTFQLILALSPALGPLIGGFVGSAAGMTGVFVALGTAAALLLAANASLLRETIPVSVEPRKFSLRGFASVYRHPQGKKLMWTSFFQAMSTMTLIVYLPSIYLHEFGMGPEGTGLSFLAMALCFMAAVKIGVALQNRWGPARVYVYATWANIATYPLIAVAAERDLTLLVAAFCLFGLTYGGSMPIPATFLTVWYPADRASANGAMNIMRFAGSAAGPMAGSVLFMSHSPILLYGGVMLLYAWSMRGSKRMINQMGGIGHA